MQVFNKGQVYLVVLLMPKVLAGLGTNDLNQPGKSDYKVVNRPTHTSKKRSVLVRIIANQRLLDLIYILFPIEEVDA